MDISTELLVLTLIWYVGGIFVFRKIRKDYQDAGKLTAIGCGALIALFVVQGTLAAVSSWGNALPAPIQLIAPHIIGVSLMILGAIICLAGLFRFQSIRQVLGLEPQELVTSGIYNWSRNPQYVGYGLFEFGVAFTWISPFSWFGFITYVIMIYMLVRYEEEHLRRIYGEAYKEYLRLTPRFAGVRRSPK
jgi:protein-S-isoprenylcysteine O-methyltransferase Ste14